MAQSEPKGLAWDVLRSPPLPAARGSRCEAGAPAPEPAEKFRRCKREKMQLSRTPAPPFPRPHPRSPTPGGGDLGHPGRSRTWEEGLPSGISRGLLEAPRGCGDLSLRRQPPGQAHPPPSPRALVAPARAPLFPLLPSRACPRAPLCASLRPDPRGRPTYPAVRRPGLGQDGLHRGGTRLSGRPGRRSRGISLSRCQTLGASRSSRSSPPHPHPSFSLVSRLFFPG